MWYVAFLLSITCHEAAHALASSWGGDKTAHDAGQVTLNPGPHIKQEPFGTVLAPILTFFLNGWMLGWASAPYDPVWADNYPRRAAWMAAAGPLANLLLAVIAGIIIKTGMVYGMFFLPDTVTFSQIVLGSDGLAAAFATFLSILFSLNVILFAFNLIPLPPLDGISVLGLILPEDAARQARRAAQDPTFAMIGLLIAWKISGHVIRPVITKAIWYLY